MLLIGRFVNSMGSACGLCGFVLRVRVPDTKAVTLLCSH